MSIYNLIENNNNCNFQTNGEERFLEEIFSNYKNSKIILFDIGGNVGNYSEMLVGKSIAYYPIDCNLVLNPITAISPVCWGSEPALEIKGLL